VAKLDDLREWLVSKIDGSEETRGDDSLISGFIRQIDALEAQVRSLTQPKTIAEWQAAKASPSATAAPVAWLYEENGERMFGHPDGYRPLGAVPLYAGSPPVEEKAVGHARYEYVRTLNPRRFAALYNEWLMGVHQFDDLVDRRRVKGEPVECGYDRTASLNAGHYVCLCGGACSHHTTGER